MAPRGRVEPAARQGIAVGAALGVAVLWGLAPLARRDAQVFAGAPVARAERGAAVARRAKDIDTRRTLFKEAAFQKSTADRKKIMAKRREYREYRKAMMSGGMEDTKALTTPSLNYDYLPSVEDIYARKFTGDSRTDPVGGRKKHSWYVLFKKDDQLFPKEKIRGELEAIGRFLKFEMSARDITFKLMKSPLEPFTSKGGAEFTLEYPMKEYGPIERGMKMRRTVRQARLVYISAAIPSGAIDPIRAKFYSSNNIVRFMTFHNSYDWEHAGEDNELLL